jgi:hypothetical protein
MPLHARGRGGDLLDVGDAERRLEQGVDEDRALQAGARLELGEQPVDVVDVPGPLDLRDHDDVEAIADLRDERGQVVQDPGRVERVDAGPQLRGAQVGVAARPHEAVAGGLLAVGGDGVLQVAQDDVRPRRGAGELGHHLLVRRVEEVDHARGRERDLPHGLGRSDAERHEEVLGLRIAAQPYPAPAPHKVRAP